MKLEVYTAVGGAGFFQELLREWRAGGATVVCREALTEKAYRAPRGLVQRLALRWRMYPGFGWQCWVGARHSAFSPDLRVVTTNPFFAPALVARAGRGRVPTVNLLYDLFPEALVQSGVVSRESWVARRCAAVTRSALRECAATVFLGERLRAYAETTHGPARRGVVIPVGARGAPFRATPPGPVRPEVPLRMLYSGQLGRMHDTATLLAAWSEWRAVPTRLTWRFQASGPGVSVLRVAAGDRPDVEWGGGLPEAAWEREMLQAQVALVTLAPGAERIVMPSKTYSALVAGQAVLAVCPRQSDLADLVIRHDCGWVVEPGDATGLRQAFAAITGDPAELLAKRRRAYEAGHRCYDVGPVAAQWMQLFQILGFATPNPITVPSHEAVF